MNLLTDGEDVVKAVGLFQSLWKLLKTPLSKIGKAMPDPNEPKDCGYIILNRSICAHYITHTKCVLTHEIEIKTTKNHLSHYYGRYLRRGGNSKLTITSPHKSHTLDEIDTGYQRFTVQLVEPLAKDVIHKLIMVVAWEDKEQEENPEITNPIICPTHELSFLIRFPSGTKVTHAQGIVRRHEGAHMPVETNSLEYKNDMLVWPISAPKLGLTYRITWKWS